MADDAGRTLYEMCLSLPRYDGKPRAAECPRGLDAVSADSAEWVEPLGSVVLCPEGHDVEAGKDCARCDCAHGCSHPSADCPGNLARAGAEPAG